MDPTPFRRLGLIELRLTEVEVLLLGEVGVGGLRPMPLVGCCFEVGDAFVRTRGEVGDPPLDVTVLGLLVGEAPESMKGSESTLLGAAFVRSLRNGMLARKGKRWIGQA